MQVFGCVILIAIVVGAIAASYKNNVSIYGKEAVDRAIAKFHVGSFIFLCALWFAIIGLPAANSQSGNTTEAIITAVVIATMIISVMLHRIHDTLREMREQNETIGNNAVESATSFDESISRLNERLKKVAGTINEIKDIVQKISERPPVIIQKKESN